MNTDRHEPNSRDLDDARLTAYALGQLDERERAAVERDLARADKERGEKARQAVEQIRALAGHIQEAARLDPGPPPSASLREAVERRLSQLEDEKMETKPVASTGADAKRSRRPWIALAVAVCLLIAVIPLYLAITEYSPHRAANELAMATAESEPATPSAAAAWKGEAAEEGEEGVVAEEARGGRVVVDVAAKSQSKSERPSYYYSSAADARRRSAPASRGLADDVVEQPSKPSPSQRQAGQSAKGMASTASDSSYGVKDSDAHDESGGYALSAPRGKQPRVAAPKPVAVVPASPAEEAGKPIGPVQIEMLDGLNTLVIRGNQRNVDTARRLLKKMEQASQVQGPSAPREPARGGSDAYGRTQDGETAALTDERAPEQRRSLGTLFEVERFHVGFPNGAPLAYPEREVWEELNRGRQRAPTDGAPGTEQYDQIIENEFLPVGKHPLSTFSIDVDTASYANVRRFLEQGRLPPPNAVRIEEMVNYFKYDYPPPVGDEPFSVNLEVAQCPWNGDHRLLRIGLKGRQIDPLERGPSNLVFLLDVSGSMSDQNKLPLVKQAMTLLVEQLTEDDRVAIVTYAGSAGVALESTNGQNKDKILRAIDSLHAGGSTHGSAGIQLAYEQAMHHFLKEGTNRVILATDGDLNVGITEDDDLVRLIRQQATSGVFLTVLGFGTGNLKDSKMEKLADHGNGTYAYIDSLREAHKVLVEQMTGSLMTIAKDVKVQVEFNPAQVQSYRLIGYENRVLANRDFDNDKKDAGEIGAGHSVTALYEIVPGRGEQTAGGEVQGLKYQRAIARRLTEEAASGELVTLRLRYKEPDGKKSKLVEHAVGDEGKRFGEASADLRFASAVASFGMVLRGSAYCGDLTLAAVEEFAISAVGDDPEGHRTEFVELVRVARELSSR